MLAIVRLEFRSPSLILMGHNYILYEFRGIATVGKLVNFEACTDIMDLLYEKDHTSALHNSPKYLAALMLACAFTFLIFVGHLDDMPMVRRSAATNLGKFAATVEPAHLKTDVMLIFEDLTQDGNLNVDEPQRNRESCTNRNN
ncbi:Serine/threonine-protein phosphatase 2A 65 kDa regulatory subunit A beta isoform [Camellia lanceoleosa]|uniref:Serine/threonine-protein phosphatase 2A 65 kDa regulatory subunit A beta isoform n=1 Tax=Camellia lanceoleosa TaxID=1840588 RepID=A0ACC0FVP1_9ERIC|nr:Serine/threonine-protein phosphatase 2A 65 kDa regulatory subunit A beta isoform [Camellia lanceoleosa]